MKGVVVFSEVFPSGTKDFRSMLDKLNLRNVDAIFVSAYRDEAGNLIKQSRELGYHNAILSQSTLYDDKTIKLFGDAVEGVIFSAPYFNDQTESAIVNNFRAAYQKKYNSKPNVWAAYGYDVVKMVTQAINQSTSSKMPLYQEVAGIKFDGATGLMSFFHDRTANKAMQIFVVKNGKFEALK
jgi:branched-chain amino acid transport system substrate-binding protein